MVVPEGSGHFYLSEDYSFCERAHQCGFEIIADSSQRLYHIGHYAYSWEDAGNGTTRYGTYTEWHCRLPNLCYALALADWSWFFRTWRGCCMSL